MSIIETKEPKSREKGVTADPDHLGTIERAVYSENKYSSGGLPVCRLCGDVQENMSSHLNLSHKMSKEDYLEQYPGWPMEPRKDSSLGALGYHDREQTDFSVKDVFGFWFDSRGAAGKKDKKVMGFKEPGPLTPKIDPNYVFEPEYTSVALLGLHLRDKILTYGPTGCHEKGTLLLMYDGTVKKVEDVQHGDLLMGPDGTPRTVQGLRRGKQEMFRVVPDEGESWVVNRDHVLSLLWSPAVENNGRVGEGVVNNVFSYKEMSHRGVIVDVSVREWLGWTESQKRMYNLFRVKGDLLLSQGGQTGFKVELLGYEDQYFGFVLDGDHRYLMGDYTVQHNSGKTSLWEQLAARLNYNFVRINFDAGVTRSDLVGQWIVKGKDMYFSFGILPSAMMLPGTIICFDEWDTVSEECSFVLQRPLEQHSQLLILEHGEQVITLHKHNLIVATANTAGMGDDTGLYSAGTRLQNFSQINRFSLTLEMTYLPEKEEKAILLRRFPVLTEEEAQFMIQSVNSIREAFMQGSISAPLSTRDAINWAEKYVIWGDLRKSSKYCFLNRMPLEDREVVRQIIERAFE